MSRVLDMRAASCGYGGVPVVRGLDLHVDEGEVVALLGANGAGKTTTLLAVSGLVEILDGTIDVLGIPMRARRTLRAVRAGLAHVTEERSVFMGLTVRENLRLAAVQRSPIGIDQVLAYFPALEGLLDRRTGLLSGGEQQMLALGRALLRAPRLLLVDELSLGLAPIIVERLLPVVRDIARDTGAGVLLVEQHVQLALEVADRTYVLARGSCTFTGPPGALRSDAGLLEASYLGG
jgi:branched-chain amino acid transport system ATP-binding protein